MELVQEVYLLTRQMPESERYGLIVQIRRAAVSVPSNLAEGYGRAHRAEYAHHVGIANGSLFELETQLLIAAEVGYLDGDAAAGAMGKVTEVGKMMAALLRALEDPARPSRVPSASC